MVYCTLELETGKALRIDSHLSKFCKCIKFIKKPQITNHVNMQNNYFDQMPPMYLQGGFIPSFERILVIYMSNIWDLV